MSIAIQPIGEESADTLLRLMKQIDDESPFALREKDEGLGTMDSIHLWVRELRRTPRQEAFIAYSGSVAAGYIIIQGEPYRRIQHRAILTLGILKKYTTQDIGDALLKAAETWGKTKGMLRFEASVVDGHDAVLAQMVGGDVGDNGGAGTGDGQATAQDAASGDFENADFQSRVAQQEACASGAGIVALVEDVVADLDEFGGRQARDLARRATHGGDQAGGGGLAVGAGDERHRNVVQEAPVGCLGK